MNVARRRAGAPALAGAGAAFLVLGTQCGLSASDPNAVVALPFAVSDQFTASGFIGDGATPGAVDMHVQDATCLPRAPGAAGYCYSFVYTPLPVGGGAPGQGFAGVYWLSPPNNFGDYPGKNVAPGATSVHFKAAASRAGVVASFGVGLGSSGAPKSHVDTLIVPPMPFTLTQEMTEYSFAIPSGVPYTEVLGGFLWTIAAADAGSGVTLYLDEIVWE